MELLDATILTKWGLCLYYWIQILTLTDHLIFLRDDQFTLKSLFGDCISCGLRMSARCCWPWDGTKSQCLQPQHGRLGHPQGQEDTLAVKALVLRAEADLARIRARWPRVQIVWSAILLRHEGQGHGATSGV